MDVKTEAHLNQLRAAAEPEVRRFVEWAAGELADKLTRDFQAFGLAPFEARKEAEAAVRILCSRVLGSARAYHLYRH